MPFISYAQNFEDVILYRALKHVWNGTYVDVGAYDPQRDSVTKAFYDRGWSGLNIEPVEVFHRRLAEARPRDRNIHAAAADRAGELTCYVIAETGLSTLDRETAERHRQDGYEICETSVPVLPLQTLLSDLVDRPIHFLKIDVEGFEDNVLAGLDLTKTRPWILVIEATIPSHDVQSHEKWENRILSKGYFLGFFDGLSRYYIADEHAGLKDRLAIPANVFDDYETAYTVELRQAIDEARKSYDALARQLEDERQKAAEYGSNLTRQIEDERQKAAEYGTNLTRRIQELELQIQEIDHANLRQLDEQRQWANDNLEKQRKLSEREEERLHAALQAARDHLARIEGSRGWRLALFLRKPLNFVRLQVRRLKARSSQETEVGPAVSEAARPLQEELNFSSREFARRITLKALRRQQ